MKIAQAIYASLALFSVAQAAPTLTRFVERDEKQETKVESNQNTIKYSAFQGNHGCLEFQHGELPKRSETTIKRDVGLNISTNRDEKLQKRKQACLSLGWGKRDVSQEKREEAQQGRITYSTSWDTHNDKMRKRGEAAHGGLNFSTGWGKRSVNHEKRKEAAHGGLNFSTGWGKRNVKHEKRKEAKHDGLHFSTGWGKRNVNHEKRKDAKHGGVTFSADWGKRDESVKGYKTRE
ncbi:hypothetical protein CDD81_3986 [Ophiocordyceps australis]|uniref:Uncharacterized protein n=1 Tax=Ophiocordyceps australis TaxID=1399860 RepID=A0A2C5YCN8_9HYPO|nr:hypothetical protein CDD81_3986 [Ophiocordyceps australis]